MALLTSDFAFRLSGGASNTSGNASLGGAISSSAPSPNVNELFDRISDSEAENGDTEYRCIYLKNASASDTIYNARVFISVNTPSNYTEVTIGLGTSALNVAEQTIANEATAPVSVTFDEAEDDANSLAVGDMAPGDYKALWIKRVVTPTVSGISSDTVTLTFKGGAAV